ncbi:hypothetical protein [Arthrobacter wenxiniae]|jgi:hypothetical protein|uniref:Uncharacterized protein n=1 Tax=Arthrobacter wenxiniae TaxID=2713570 RepID=A0A7Y7II05_9MICC|nr:hypothetical protein [Arthrobacter wenxiniae]NVM95607.1 hypothetical protein [Arthrobacter wenxiniae]
MLKGLFGDSRQGRRDDAELGKGVWRRAHDRFRRGLDRFHQMLEGVEEEARNAPSAGDDYAALVPVANALAELLPLVRGIAARAHAVAPSEGMEIPTGTGGYLNDVHRELSRAGNALAAAAEAVAMVRLGAGEVPGVVRRAGMVQAHVNRAAELLDKGPSGPA